MIEGIIRLLTGIIVSCIFLILFIFCYLYYLRRTDKLEILEKFFERLKVKK